MYKLLPLPRYNRPRHLPPLPWQPVAPVGNGTVPSPSLWSPLVSAPPDLAKAASEEGEGH